MVKSKKKKKRGRRGPRGVLTTRAERIYGSKFEENVYVKGKTGKKPYLVDLHAWRQFGYVWKGWRLSKNIEHIWMDYNSRNVTPRDVEELNKAVNDFRAATKTGTTKWSPKEVVIASRKGFTEQAIDLADKYDIRCATIGEESLDFVTHKKSHKGRDLLITIGMYGGMILLIMLLMVVLRAINIM